MVGMNMQLVVHHYKVPPRELQIHLYVKSDMMMVLMTNHFHPECLVSHEVPQGYDLCPCNRTGSLCTNNAFLVYVLACKPMLFMPRLTCLSGFERIPEPNLEQNGKQENTWADSLWHLQRCIHFKVTRAIPVGTCNALDMFSKHFCQLWKNCFKKQNYTTKTEHEGILAPDWT